MSSSIEERGEAKMRKCLILALTTVGAFLLFANSAFASGGHLHPVLPGGLDTHNSRHAWKQFNSRAAFDTSLGSRLASNTGERSYNANHYQVVGYGKASPNSTNTAIDDNGHSVPAGDTSHCKVGAKVLIVLNVVTENEAEICTGCANPRIARIIHNLPSKPWSLSTVMAFHRKVQKPFKITCPSGQKVSGVLKAWVNGKVGGRSWGQLQGRMSARIRAFVNAKIHAEVNLRCGPAPKPPAPKPTPPPAGSCNANNSPGAVVCSSFYVIVTCGGAQITINGATQQEAIQNASQYVSQNCNSSTPPCNCTPPPPPVCPPGTTGTPPNCVTPPTAPSVTITSTTTLNDIPEGKDSGPFYITVNASAAGTLTIDPGVGGVSDCNSSTPQGSITLPFGAGNSTLCVKLYAPMDANANSMTISETAIVTTSGGTAKDVKSQTFTISHPVRP